MDNDKLKQVIKDVIDGLLKGVESRARERRFIGELAAAGLDLAGTEWKGKKVVVTYYAANSEIGSDTPTKNGIIADRAEVVATFRR